MISWSLLTLEFKRSLKGLLVWSISLGLTLFLIIMIYPLVSDMFTVFEEMMDYFEAINPGFVDMMEVFGGIPDNGVEYFATEGALFMQLLGGIYAALVGFSIINKDDKERTTEVLYVLPMSRYRFLLTKIIHAIIVLAIFTVIQISSVHLGFLIVSPGEDLSALWMFGVFDFLMFVMLAMFGMLLAVFLKPNRSQLISIAIPFPLYIMTMIAFATDNESLKAIKYLSPFTFTEPVGWLKGNVDFELINFITFASLSVVALIVSLIRFRRREII